jgi:polyhydroxyalkanoate synthesis regulator protein
LQYMVDTLTFDSAGIGTIRAGQDTFRSCDWKCTQKHDGTIKVHCRLKPGALNELRTAALETTPSPPVWGIEEHGFSFEGQTNDGRILRLQNVEYMVADADDMELVFYVSEIICERLDPTPLSHIAFRMVNYKILAVPKSQITLPNGISLEGTFVPLHLPYGIGWLRAIEGHSNIIKELAMNGGVQVTTEFILPIVNKDAQRSAIKTAQQLCCVLTLLSGNRVNWISYAAICQDGSISDTGAQNAVTRSYQRTDLFNLLSTREVQLNLTGTSYAPIINRMMERMESAQDNWNITAIINSFHEAISSEHFLEQQGQLLANCMEMLRQSFLQNSANEFVLSNDTFEAKKKDLIKAVKIALKEQFPPEAHWTEEECKSHATKISLMSTHIQGANRYGFKHSLKEMANRLSLFSQSAYEAQEEKPDSRGYMTPLRLDPTRKEMEEASLSQHEKTFDAALKAFVTIRDHLTHQGKFLVPKVDNEAEWTTKKVNEERVRQQRFMERVVAAYITAILGWNQPLATPPILYPEYPDKELTGAS